MGAFRFDIRGLRSLNGKLDSARLIDPVMKDMFEQIGIAGEREARQGAPRDTGALARSIVSESTSTMARVHSPLEYAPVMEHGRRPGSRMPPPAALAGWASRHGASGFEFVIARSIARRGIKGRFFMRKALRALKETHVPRLIRKAAVSIEGRFGR